MVQQVHCGKLILLVRDIGKAWGKELLTRSHCDFSYPFTINSYFVMMLYDRFLIRGVKQAEANVCIMIVEEVNMANAKFVFGRMH
jgi:hypothetical protein